MSLAQSDTTQAIASQKSIELFWWPNFDSTYSTIAIVLCIVIFLIAYFAGLKLNGNKFLFSVIMANVLGFFAMPFIMSVFEKFSFLASKWGIIMLVMCMMLLVSALSVGIYEIIVVTAKEAIPTLNRSS